jgi:hypothetical protein
VSTWESDLLVGIAGYLSQQSVGIYNPAGYQATDTAIVFGDLPSTPNRCIGLTLYSAVDHPVQNLSTVRLQLMFRGDANNSLDVGDLATQAFAALQGITDRDYGTAHLIQMFRVSGGIPLGIDDLKRSTRADNYQIDVNTPYTAGRTL